MHHSFLYTSASIPALALSALLVAAFLVTTSTLLTFDVDLTSAVYRPTRPHTHTPPKPWGAPPNLTAAGIGVALSQVRSAVSSCPEFRCRGWPGRRNCTGVLPGPRHRVAGWSPTARSKDCSRTKLGSWDFDGNDNIDFLLFHLFFLAEIPQLGSEPLGFGRVGVAVEFGAQNGIDASNSRFFERHLGWDVLLIEPTSCFRAARRNRPRATVVHGAVCKNRKNITLPGSTRWCKHEGGEAEETVECYPLRDLFEQHGRMSLIDLVSVDSEGMEMEALESIDFSKVDVRVLVVEWRERDGSKRRDYLAKFGYLSAFISRTDELFWRPDLFDLHTVM